MYDEFGEGINAAADFGSWLVGFFLGLMLLPIFLVRDTYRFMREMKL